MGRVKRLAWNKVALSFIDKGNIKIFRREDVNFNGVIGRAICHAP